MTNWTQSQAKPKRGKAILGFVVLLGIIFNLACAESVTAGNENDLNGDGKTDIVWRKADWQHRNLIFEWSPLELATTIRYEFNSYTRYPA
ncbi:FG-GAP repeat protein [Nitrospira sp. Ecomares 2.1]